MQTYEITLASTPTWRIGQNTDSSRENHWLVLWKYLLIIHALGAEQRDMIGSFAKLFYSVCIAVAITLQSSAYRILLVFLQMIIWWSRDCFTEYPSIWKSHCALLSRLQQPRHNLVTRVITRLLWDSNDLVTLFTNSVTTRPRWSQLGCYKMTMILSHDLSILAQLGYEMIVISSCNSSILP